MDSRQQPETACTLPFKLLIGKLFHELAVANGGRDEGPPGIRENYNANHYGAFVRDPDGNKVEAVTFTARERLNP
jgi:hypothetical protein